MRTAHWPWLGKALTKLVHFTRKDNGGWKRERATLRVTVGNNFRFDDCDSNIPFGDSENFKLRRKRKVKFHKWGMDTWTTAFDGEVSGCGFINEVPTISMCLILD